MSEPVEHRINVSSIYGLATRQPIVQVEVPVAMRAPVMRPGGPGTPVEDPALFGVQMRPEEARSLALNLLQAAEGALVDGFLLTFLRDEIDLELGELAPILVKFRGHRTRQSPEGT